MILFIDIEKADRGAQKHGKDGKYVSVGGTDAQIRALAKERGLYVPPAWRNVQLNKNPKAALQIKAIDSKGRSVSIRSAEHAAKASAEKFDRLKEFVKSYKKLENKIVSDFDKHEEAKVLYLISKTGFRIGSDRDTKAEKQAYGASTLQSQHVTINGNSLAFKFTGKKGVTIPQTIEDSKLAGVIKARTGRLFNTTDKKVRSYLKSIDGDFKVKDFRTFVGTETAIRAAAKLPKPKTLSEFKKFQKEVCKAAATKLCNTVSVAKKYYVAQEVFDKYYDVKWG